MKRILITGGGSKLGKELVSIYSKSRYQVDSISSSDSSITGVNNIKVNWYDLDYDSFTLTVKKLIENKTPYSSIIINHNSGGMYNSSVFGKLTKEDHRIWSKQYFLCIQTLDILLKELNSNITEQTKIICLLSGIIGIYDKNSLAFTYPGYAGIKSNILYNMLGYSKSLKGTYICVNPGHMETESDYIKTSKQFFDLENNLTSDSNGSLISIDGTDWECVLKGCKF